MEKILQPSTGIDNVGVGNQWTHNLRKGPFYHHVTYIGTLTKTAATAGFTSPTLADFIGLLEVRVNTEARRVIQAMELDTIQQAWGSVYAAVATDGIANDLITAAQDVVAGGNTTRTTTFQFTIYFTEPWRNSYVAQRFFGLPTLWPSGQTVDIQVAAKTPANALITNIVIRAEEFVDFAKGPHLKTLANGQPDTTSPAILPMVNFWRLNKNYSGTDFSITDWGSVAGKLQQVSIFGQANDFLTKFKLLGDNIVKRDTTKARNDQLNVTYEFDYPIPTLTAPYDKANVTHIALDVSDDVTDWFQFDQYKNVELALTLNQAAAANKVLYAIVQAYDVIQLPAKA